MEKTDTKDTDPLLPKLPKIRNNRTKKPSKAIVIGRVEGLSRDKIQRSFTGISFQYGGKKAKVLWIGIQRDLKPAIAPPATAPTIAPASFTPEVLNEKGELEHDSSRWIECVKALDERCATEAADAVIERERKRKASREDYEGVFLGVFVIRKEGVPGKSLVVGWGEKVKVGERKWWRKWVGFEIGKRR